MVYKTIDMLEEEKIKSMFVVFVTYCLFHLSRADQGLFVVLPVHNVHFVKYDGPVVKS